jgi:hypothetical protein
MKTNDLPLITTAVLKASQKNASASTQAPQTQVQVESTAASSQSNNKTTFTAEVVASQPQSKSQAQAQTKDQSSNGDSKSWQITIRAEGRHLTVQSEQPLPKGSQLTLTTDNGQPPKVEVVEIKLPAQATTAKTTSALLQSLATQLNNTMNLPAPVRDMLSARIQWQQLSPSVSIPTAGAAKTGSTPLSNAYLVGSQAGKPQAGAGAANTTANTTSSLLLQLLNRPLTTSSGTAASTAASTTSAAIPSTSASSNASTNTTVNTTTIALNSLSAALPGKLPQLAQAFVQSQPTATQLAQPAQLKTSIENAPTRYEQQVLSRLTDSLLALQSAVSSEQGAKPTSGDSLSQVFKQLWAKTAVPNATSTTNAQPTQAGSNLHGQAEAGKSSLASLIAQMRGNSPSVTTNSTTSPTASSTASSTPSHPSLATSSNASNIVLNAAILSFLAGSSIDSESSSLTSMPLGSAQLSPMNLKGLLLNLVRHWPAELPARPTATSSSINSGTANSGTANNGTANTDPSNTARQIELRTETFRLIQTALSQIEHEQVRLTQNSDQFQIPLLWRDGQQLQQALMDVRQENDSQNHSSNKADKKHRWQITLHFDLSGLGPLDIELDLCLPSVSATFWSERSDTLASLNQALQPLRQTLTELGADVGELKARHGQKPASDQPIVRHSLVDLHT